MPAGKQKLGYLPSPALHTSTASTRNHQQLSCRCQHSSARAATAHLGKDLVVSSPTSCWQQTGATRSQRIHTAETLNYELVLSFTCPLGSKGPKRLLSKMSKVDLNSHLESRQHRCHTDSVWLFLPC